MSCTQLTSRDDIIRAIQGQCVEYQRVDGVREIRSKSGKVLLVAIRNIDVGSKDEYNHSEIYTLLWSIVAHKRLYLKQGLSVELKNILVACTAEHYEDIPPRLRRIMGFVRLQSLQQKDVE